ncbi:MAG: septum site-determining protein MinC [Betaproteobacteria bacterium]|nr:septum site-determining protein MinC [Betaproteobacteria bacterium]
MQAPDVVRPERQEAGEPDLEIRSASFTLIVLRLHHPDVSMLARQLDAQLARAPGFFSNDAVVFDLQGIAALDVVPDFSALAAMTRAHNLFIAGVSGGSGAQLSAAHQAGFGVFPSPSKPSKPSPPQSPRSDAPSAPAPVALPRKAKIIDKPVRTGQQIYAEGSDLILTALVSPGAEVIADGNIHAYAPLRGRALAGVKGDTQARIFAQCMEAELLAIAGCYRLMEDKLPDHLCGKPAQALLRGTQLLIEPLIS